MLDRCANLQCSRRFLRLGQGRLFLVESENASVIGVPKQIRSPYLRVKPRRVERYWLCDQCAETWTLVHDRETGISLLPFKRGPVGTSERTDTRRSA
jgi:hypothetical protein